MPVITLIGKPGCHLCDDARDVIALVVEELSAVPDAGEVSVEEQSILDDEGLHRQYWEEIPVVLIDGRKHTYWRVDRERLRTGILRAASRSSESKGTA